MDILWKDYITYSEFNCIDTNTLSYDDDVQSARHIPALLKKRAYASKLYDKKLAKQLQTRPDTVDFHIFSITIGGCLRYVDTGGLQSMKVRHEFLFAQWHTITLTDRQEK